MSMHTNLGKQTPQTEKVDFEASYVWFTGGCVCFFLAGPGFEALCG